MRDILVTVIVFGSIPVILYRAYIGVFIFAWLSYMNPHRLTWGFAYDMPFAAVIGIITLISFLITKDKEKLPINSLVLVWIIWIFWMTVTTVFAIEFDSAIIEWKRVMKIQLIAIITIMLLQSKERIYWFVWVIALSIGFFGIKGGVFTLLTSGEYLVYGPPGSFFEGNNGLAVALIMILPLFRYLQLQTNNKWVRYGIYAAMLLIGLSILASYSRGAFLGIVAAATYMILKSKRKLLFLPFMLVIFVSLLFFMPEKWHDRIETIQSYEEDGSAMGRINAWYFAFNLVKDRPIVGGGYHIYDPKWFYVYAPDPEDFHDSHSIYFESLGEHGFVGLIIFLTLGWLGLRYGNKIRAMTEKHSDLQWAYQLASMLQVSIVGYAVSGAFVGLAYFDLYYHLLALMILAYLEVKKVLESQEYKNEAVSRNLIK